MSALHERQREREPLAIIRAQTKVSHLSPPDSRSIRRLLKRAEETPRPSKRIRLALQAASTWGEPIAPVSACRRGCAHCCQIPVLICESEAQLLASASGRTVVAAPESAVTVQWSQATSIATAAAIGAPRDAGPCPFLRDNACSVYEDRPLACRTHFNLDDDELLCEVDPDHPVGVPYANAMQIRIMCYATAADGERFADIRDFFPG